MAKSSPRLPQTLYGPLTEALPGTQPARARWIGEGWGAAAYRVPAARGDRAGDWVLRVPRPGVPWAVEDLEREARMLPLLALRPFEVAVPRNPRLVTSATGETIGALHRLVPGEGTATRRLHGAARRQHLAAIGRFFSVLHTTPPSLAHQYGVTERDLWESVTVPHIEATMAVAGPATRHWLQGRVETFEALDRSDVPHALIHGDVSAEHLLADEHGRLSGVIDFAEARLADPALDFAGVLNRFGWRDLEVVLANYEAPVDATLLERARIYIEIAPIYSVTDGFTALGASERAIGLRRLAARAARGTRNQTGTPVVPPQ
ncbi:MAG: aminoglycoside phosphotransferase family protein [Chloroflexi bacterium]|nr:aminoglycoside phosphotransferase family protein [Chloroflexota bacterium]